LKYLLKNARKWLKYARKALVFDRKVKNIENSEISLTGSPKVPSIDRIASVSYGTFLLAEVPEIRRFRGFHDNKQINYRGQNRQ